MSFPDDSQYRDDRIRSVEGGREHGWSMALVGGWNFLCPASSPVEPIPGMSARLYGKGLGYIVRGLFLDGREVFYRTAAQQAARDRADAEERDRERRCDFERDRADMDRRFEALPEPFRDRIAWFRRAKIDFRWEHEGYELATCELAAAISSAFRGRPGDLVQFRAASFDDQRAAVPAIDDGFSWNQVGCAIYLAGLLLTDPDSVARAHGAMCPLVGCEDYGCFASRREAPHAP